MKDVDFEVEGESSLCGRLQTQGGGGDWPNVDVHFFENFSLFDRI